MCAFNGVLLVNRTDLSRRDQPPGPGETPPPHWGTTYAAFVVQPAKADAGNGGTRSCIHTRECEHECDGVQARGQRPKPRGINGKVNSCSPLLYSIGDRAEQQHRPHGEQAGFGSQQSRGAAGEGSEARYTHRVHLRARPRGDCDALPSLSLQS